MLHKGFDTIANFLHDWQLMMGFIVHFTDLGSGIRTWPLRPLKNHVQGCHLWRKLNLYYWCHHWHRLNEVQTQRAQVSFWPRFYIVVLGIAFFQVASTFSIFFLDFYFPFISLCSFIYPFIYPQRARRTLKYLYSH